MNFLSNIASIITPVGAIIDSLHTSEEEKMTAQLEVIKEQNKVTLALMQHEHNMAKIQSDTILAEAKSGNWLTSAWRPIAMLVMLGLVVADSFGWLPNPLAEDAWTVLMLGIGGYTVGRSAEKVAKEVIKAKGK